MSSRSCDCPTRQGISIKSYTHTKIMQCLDHGLFCPFDGWQFKSPWDLYHHFKKSTDEPLHCEGWDRYGEFTVHEAEYELYVFLCMVMK